MEFYSAPTRYFMFFVWFLGLAAIVATLCLPPVPGDHFPPVYVGAALLLAAIAGTCKMRLLHSRQSGETRYLTPAFLVTFGTLLALGIRAGVLAGIVSVLIADLYSRNKSRNKLHKVLFNIASVAMTAWCAGQVFAWLNGSVGHVTRASLLPVFLSISCYFLLNAGSFACLMALISREPLRRVLRRDFAWAYPVHLAGGAYVAFAIICIKDVPLLLLGASIVPFAYQYYKMYGDNVGLIDELDSGQTMLRDLYLSTVKSLATAIAAKDQYTHAHIHRVQHYAVAIATNLGVTGDELEAIRTGAVLHDIGKLGVPDYVLLKPGKLSSDEMDKMKQHPVVGADILEPVHFPWPVADVVRHHHERWDGGGYPDGLAGEAIPLSARILSVADVFDALTSDRPYRPAWSPQKTQDYLLTQAGLQFDPQVVCAFLEVVEEAGIAIEASEGPSMDEAAGGQAHGYGLASDASRRIRRTASELWVLYEVSQALNASVPMQQRLSLLGLKLTAIMPDTTCAFLLYDTPQKHDALQEAAIRTLPVAGPLPSSATLSAESEGCEAALPCLRVFAAAGWNADLLYAHAVLDANAPAAIAARNRKPFRGAYIDEGLTWSMSQDPTRPIRSILIVPLTQGEETLGAMTFYHGDTEAFSSDDENLLIMIAEQVQTALSQEREHDRTRSDANTDALTGLSNMRYLRHKTAALLHAPSGDGEPLALLYLDLDNFKNINTVYGHPLGSRVLRDVAQLLPHELRPTDIAVRYGGDEFIIVLPHTSEAGAREVAGRIRHAIRNYRPAFLDDLDASCHLDVSIGVACHPEDGDDMEEMVAIADRRMYQVKMAQKDENAALASTALPTMRAGSLCVDTAIVADILEKWPVASGRREN